MLFFSPYQYSVLIFHIILAFSFYYLVYIFLNDRQKQKKKKEAYKQNKEWLHHELNFLGINLFYPINFSRDQSELWLLQIRCQQVIFKGCTNKHYKENNESADFKGRQIGVEFLIAKTNISSYSDICVIPTTLIIIY